jgi:hypothetical protein
MINTRVVRHWKKKLVRNLVMVSTEAGSFKTKRSCDIEFTLPAFLQSIDKEENNQKEQASDNMDEKSN